MLRLLKIVAIMGQSGVVIFCSIFYFEQGPILNSFRSDAAIIRECSVPLSESDIICKDAAFRIALLAPATVEFTDARRFIYGTLAILAFFSLIFLVIPQSKSQE